MNNNSLRICEHCKEEILYNARRCPYCGSLLGIQAQTGYYREQSPVNGDENTVNQNIINQNTSRPNSADYSSYQNNTNNYTNNYTNNNSNYNTNNNINYNSNYNTNNNTGRISLEKSELSNDMGQAYGERSYQNSTSNNDGTIADNKNDASATDYSYGAKYYNSYVNMESYEIRPLSNRMKVFLTTFSSFVPWLGQLIGIIAAIVFLNNEEDDDRRSFGRSLLASALITFIITTVFILFIISAFI